MRTFERTILACLAGGVSAIDRWNTDDILTTELFSNRDATGESLVEAVSGNNDLKWELTIQSYQDMDEGNTETTGQYMEWTSTLTMPIKDTDDITFHIEYYT